MTESQQFPLYFKRYRILFCSVDHFLLLNLNMFFQLYVIWRSFPPLWSLYFLLPFDVHLNLSFKKWARVDLLDLSHCIWVPNCNCLLLALLTIGFLSTSLQLHILFSHRIISFWPILYVWWWSFHFKKSRSLPLVL